MVTDVRIKNSTGWSSIYAGAVPDSVRIKNAGGFVSVVGLDDPPAERKFIRNLANTDWYGLDIIPPSGTAILRAEFEDLNLPAGFNTVISGIPIGDPDPNRWVIIAVSDLYISGQGVMNNYIGKIGGGSSVLFDLTEQSGTSSSVGRMTMGAYTKQITSGTTVDIEVRPANNSYQTLAHYGQYVQVWTIIAPSAFDLSHSSSGAVSSPSAPATMVCPEVAGGQQFSFVRTTWIGSANACDMSATPQDYNGARWTDAAGGSGYSPPSLNTFWSWSQRENIPAGADSTQLTNILLSGNRQNETGFITISYGS